MNAALLRTARTLGRASRAAKPLPTLFFVTDPGRTPHPQRIMARLPRGAAVIWRPFGLTPALAQGPSLRALARQRGLIFLVGADAALAARLKADGVHLPQRLAHRAGPLRRAHPNWLVTAAAHSARALRTARGAHAALLSPVFASRSPSAGGALGAARFAALVRAAPLPVIALGGVSARTARRLTGSGAVGLAAVGGFLGG